MSKSIEHKTCRFCESTYKLSFNHEDTSGHPKFCPFCGSEAYDDSEDEATEDEE